MLKLDFTNPAIFMQDLFVMDFHPCTYIHMYINICKKGATYICIVSLCCFYTVHTWMYYVYVQYT